MDKLGADDNIRGDPVKLEVREVFFYPYYCCSPASVTVHQQKETRRLVDTMVQ